MIELFFSLISLAASLIGFIIVMYIWYVFIRAIVHLFKDEDKSDDSVRML